MLLLTKEELRSRLMLMTSQRIMEIVQAGRNHIYHIDFVASKSEEDAILSPLFFDILEVIASHRDEVAESKDVVSAEEQEKLEKEIADLEETRNNIQSEISDLKDSVARL